MIDIDELERIVKAGDRCGHSTPGVTLDLIAEVRRLRNRLEIDSRHPYDGIHCRDETIRQLEGEVRALREDAERWRALVRWTEEYNRAQARVRSTLYRNGEPMVCIQCGAHTNESGSLPCGH